MRRACFLGPLRNPKGGGPRRRLAAELWHTWHLANADNANLSLGVECGEQLPLAGQA